jgi:hypothetical protein
MHEQRTQRVTNVVSNREVDIRERRHHIQHAPEMHLDAGAAQQATEHQHVVDERFRHLHADRWRSAARRSPRMASMSSFALSSTPSVSSTAAGSSAVAVQCHERGGPVERLGHARHLVELLATHALHERRDLLARRCEAAGTRSRTIACSFSKLG